VLLLREAALASGARWRPSQLWLLLLRCALLAALALALAEPWVARHVAGGAVWFVEPGLEGELPHGAGAGKLEVRYLAPGLPVQAPATRAAAGREAEGARVSEPTGANSRVAERHAPDLWSLLVEADDLFPAGITFHVVARPRLDALVGARPRIAHAVVWQRSAAGAGAGGAVGAAGAVGTRAAAAQAAAGGAARDGSAQQPAGQRATVVAAGRPAAEGATAAPRVRLLIAATPERAADAAVLRDGLVRGGGDLGWPVAIAAAGDSGAADLLVSLGAAAPAAWMARVARGGTLLGEGDGNAAPCASLVATRCCGLFERTACGSEPEGEPVWRDGSGATALSRTRFGAGSVLTYGGRFSPAAGGWSRGAYIALLQEAFGPPQAFPPQVETSIAQALPRGSGGGAAAPPTMAAEAQDGAGRSSGSFAGGSATAARDRGDLGEASAGAFPVDDGAGGTADVRAGDSAFTGGSGRAAGAGAAGGPGAPGDPGEHSLAEPLWLAVGLLFAAERWLAGRVARAGGGQPA
jgi:hypothetical protein